MPHKCQFDADGKPNGWSSIEDCRSDCPWKQGFDDVDNREWAREYYERPSQQEDWEMYLENKDYEDNFDKPLSEEQKQKNIQKWLNEYPGKKGKEHLKKYLSMTDEDFELLDQTNQDEIDTLSMSPKDRREHAGKTR